MQTNVLIAIANIVNTKIINVVENNVSTNRANNMGESLERYVKDIFCNSLTIDDPKKDFNKYRKYFSFEGSQNTPPDLIIRNGDAIEVKKIENIRSSISLNSSYPKDKLHSDSTLISNACRECEKWDVKDLLYCIGIVNGRKLKCLWFVYGDCYAADKSVYERIKNTITSGVENIPDVIFSETNEIARINNVDPLKITYFRIRGMWGIENPINVFDVPPLNKNAAFTLYAIMKEKKYLSFPDKDRKRLEDIKDSNFMIKDINIKSPNNPMKFIKGKIIKYEI